jgi:NADPH-dependent glutamate synthase beta subunit-like oxidoreductase
LRAYAYRGIPEYRLPTEISNYEIDKRPPLGVTIKLNTRIDDPAALLEKGFKLFIAYRRP